MAGPTGNPLGLMWQIPSGQVSVNHEQCENTLKRNSLVPSNLPTLQVTTGKAGSPKNNLLGLLQIQHIKKYHHRPSVTLNTVSH